MSIAEMRDLYRVALARTNGDTGRAKRLVSAYVRGQVDAAIVASRAAA